jgi:hypothetical protein
VKTYICNIPGLCAARATTHDLARAGRGAGMFRTEYLDANRHANMLTQHSESVSALACEPRRESHVIEFGS